ncbi:acetyl-CoA carboxylase biotin carboxylase subunit [Archaeoglobales archaeon]|nr:MAG: acetyl-CoA carboxylase biotin carboxylase subunit [Archaeoglobales archaeon]
MFEKILVANRGDVAIRVMRACRELGIKTVTIYSDADKRAFHRVYADESYYIGKSEPKESYLNIEKILKVAKKADVDAIHPGYGFLSENPQFAERCIEEGFVFIGPKPKVLAAAGSKLSSRKLMEEAGVPVIPGSPKIKSLDDALKWAEKFGYPVAVKASGGGGGIGITIARNEEEMEKAYKQSKKLGERFFIDSAVYVEKYLEKPRHIEFQILADEKGNTIHLGERECSIQRRHQKLIEECPSVAVDDETRQRIGKLAVKGAKHMGYTNSGTIEFLYSNGEFYFLEVNARLQVEHTITEIVTGIDIVKYQIKIAYGEELEHGQEDVSFRGHAIECRIYAEDPINFLPRSGRIEYYRSPGGIGIRVDSGIHMGYRIPEYYDSMISKLIAWGNDRQEAIMRMRRALYEYLIGGVETNIPFHRAVMNNEAFVKGNTHTGFVEEQRIEEAIKHYVEIVRKTKEKLDEIFRDRFTQEEVMAMITAIIEDSRTVEIESKPILQSLWKTIGRLEGLKKS